MLSPRVTTRTLKITVLLADDVLRFTRRTERSIERELRLLQDEYPRARAITIREAA